MTITNAQRRAETDRETSIQERVQYLEDQLKRTDSELQSLTYSISHDLRAPLRAIIGFSQIINDEYAADLPEEGLHYFAMLHASAEQMNRLMAGILTLSRLGRRPLEKQEFAISAMARTILNEQIGDHPERKIEGIVGSLPDCVADPALLKEVFNRLISNAVKFTRTKDIARIEVGTLSIGNECAYFVRDNGVGLDVDNAKRLFELFQRFHLASEYEGDGVGLAIVSRILTRHGGRVWAESSPGQGACFYFTLPDPLNPVDAQRSEAKEFLCTQKSSKFFSSKITPVTWNLPCTP